MLSRGAGDLTERGLFALSPVPSIHASFVQVPPTPAPPAKLWAKLIRLFAER